MTAVLAVLLLLLLLGDLLALCAAFLMVPEDREQVRRWVNRIMDRVMR